MAVDVGAFPGRSAAGLESARAQSRGSWWPIGLVALLAALLRFAGLGSQPLWLDEGYSWWDAHQSLSALWNLVPQCDPHPVLYFVLLKGWTDAFGDSSFTLRAFSALVGVLTTVVVALAGREIDRRVGWLAGLFFALTPFQIEFGHEARPYTLLCLGAALIAFGALRIARLSRVLSAQASDVSSGVPGSEGATDPSAWIWRGGFWGFLALFVGGTIVLWTNNTSILILASLCAALALILLGDRSSRPLIRPLVLVIALVVVLWLPYLPVLLQQARGVESDFWIPRPEGWRFANELRMVVSLSAFDAVWWAVAALGAGALLLWRRGAWREAVTLVCLVALPVALNYGISMTIKPIFIARALIGVAPAVVVLLAAGVMLIRPAALRHSAVAMLVLAHVLALGYWYENYQGKEPWDRIATQVVHPHRDEVVLVAANELALPLEHAFEDIHGSEPVQGAPANFPSPGMPARYPSGKCAPSVQGQDMTAVARAIRGRRTVYFITRTNNVYDPGNLVSRYLQRMGFQQVGVTSYSPGSLEVHQFVLSSSAVASAESTNRHPSGW